MAELSDVAILCKFDNTVVKSFGGLTENCVVLTSSQRVSVYNVGDHQLLQSWFAKSGQLLTSPAVKLCDDQHYSVIIDQKIIQSWSTDDNFIDRKSLKIKLLKPAHQIFPLKNRNSVVIYDDATVGFSNNPATFWGQAADYDSVVWCSICSSGSGKAVVAVFESYDAGWRIFKYSLTTDEDSIQSVELYTPPASESPVAGYCLQSSGDIYLLTLYEDGRVNRTALTAGGSSGLSSDIFLPPVDSVSRYVDVASLDELQLAIVLRDQNTAYVEVWDVKYRVRHSQSKVDLSKLGQIQHLRVCAGNLLLICGSGVCLFPFELKPVTLLRAMNCRNSLLPRFIQHCQSEGVIKEDIVATFSKLTDVSQTPAYESFKTEFSKLNSWLESCGSCPEFGLSALPLVDAVIKRVCDNTDTFWPVEELMVLAKARLVSNNICQSLFEAISRCCQFDLLCLCLENIRDIPEAAIVISLECILRKESNEVFRQFSLTREQIVNLVLRLPYNECFLMEYIWKLEFSLVMELVSHLYRLWDSDEVSNMQVCKWMYVVASSHSHQFSMFSECDSHLQNFNEKVKSEISKWLKLNMEPDLNLDETKLKAIQQNTQRERGYYITSFVHPFDD